MTIQRILLDDDCFTQCLRQYIADEKPDPIQTKQLESWQMSWTNHNFNNVDDGTKKEARSDNSDDSSIIPILNFIPTHALSGTLQISNEYMILTLVTNCVWMGDMSTKNGSIRFTCHASARTNNSNNTVPATSDGLEVPTKKKKKDSARQGTMVERLCRDEYIRKILVPTTTADTENDINIADDRHLFCSASIDIKSNENEERVYCDEAIGEAIRRTVYSSSDSVLDIVDLLFRLPYLPCTSGSTSSSSSSSSSTNQPNVDGTDCPAVVTSTTKLADRVRLRLLEEATYDVCDNEPDDELVDDLSIQDKNKSNDDDDDDDGHMDGPVKAPPTAVNLRKNKKVKR